MKNRQAPYFRIISRVLETFLHCCLQKYKLRGSGKLQNPERINCINILAVVCDPCACMFAIISRSSLDDKHDIKNLTTKKKKKMFKGPLWV